ncbi:MAG: hypothetical protein ACE5JL_06580, partial [Dehalococcoidia bacterium]
MSIFRKLQQLERQVEKGLFNLERRTEHFIARLIPGGLAKSSPSRKFLSQIDGREEPYRSYYLVTHPDPAQLRVDGRYIGRKDLKINLGAGTKFKDFEPEWITVDVGPQGDHTG